MPVDFLTSVLFEGTDVIPGWEYIKKYAPVALTAAGIKYYFSGATNTWERDMHGKVFIVTGGTAGVGSEIVRELANKGAQIILLVRSTEDIWVVDYVQDLREQTNNFMIYAEQCDLSSLWSVRQFATKWLDNQPPRRLDGVICCAAEMIPRGMPRQITQDGVERQIGINYLANFHLLTLLGPSLRVQPPDRDVRVVLATCSSQAAGVINRDDLLWEKTPYPSGAPWRVHGTSKLLMGLFAREYQKRLSLYERKDKAPCNVRINMVNPGIMRTPSTRRFISMGSVWGLLLYLVLWPIWFLFLKSSSAGAQSFMFAIMAPILSKVDGGNLIQECKLMTVVRPEFKDEELQSSLYEETEKVIERLEKRAAIERNKNKKEKKAKPVNLHEKPSTVEELDEKLAKLRKDVGIPGSSGDQLFPTDIPTTPAPAPKPTKRSKKKT